MEIMSFITTILFLIFLLVATPCSCSSSSKLGGGSELSGGLMDSSSSLEGVYEIDYRGPETHSSHVSPVPDHSNGRPWIIHHQHQPPHNPTVPNLIKASKVGA